jgi:hypothetical protein
MYVTYFIVALLAFAGMTKTSFAVGKGDRMRDLYRSAASMNVEHLSYMDYGVYGKRGGTVIFLAHQDDVRSEDQLYWTMVKVLSGKFGCFMKARTKTDRSYSFRCRDGRRVDIRHGQAGMTQYFSVRQFDDYGRQILIAYKD